MTAKNPSLEAVLARIDAQYQADKEIRAINSENTERKLTEISKQVSESFRLGRATKEEVTEISTILNGKGGLMETVSSHDKRLRGVEHKQWYMLGGAGAFVFFLDWLKGKF